MRSAVTGFRVLGAALLAGGVIFLMAGPAVADHGEDHDGICMESPVAQPGDPDEGVATGGIASSDATGVISEPAADEWCFGYTGGTGAGGVPESAGTLDDDDLVGQAGPRPVPPRVDETCDGRGGQGTGEGGGVEPDTGFSVPGEGLPSVGWIGASSSDIEPFLSCPARGDGVADTGEGIVAPNRIDAGAGAMAATSGAGPAAGAIMGGSALLVAVLEGLRRRRRR